MRTSVTLPRALLLFQQLLLSTTTTTTTTTTIASASQVVQGLTPEQCATYDTNELWSGATAVADAATAELMESGKFAGFVEGFSLFVTGSENCNATGGGTNCDGIYFSYGFDSAALPEGWCDTMVSHPSDCGGPVRLATVGCPLCHQSSGLPINSTVFTPNFVLQPGDAVAFYGCTPPPMEYFGWDPIINMRTNETFPFYPGTNFGNALSFRRINASSSSSSKASSSLAPFGQPALVVHTADGDAAAAVAAAYESTGGVAPSSITTHALGDSGGDLLFANRSLGAAANPDMLSMVFRATMATEGYEDAFAAYGATIYPVRLFLAKDGAPAGQALTPQVMPRETTSTATNDAAATPAPGKKGSEPSSSLPTEAELLGGTLETLAAAVQATFLSSSSSSSSSKPNAKYIGTTVGTNTPFGYYDDWGAVLDAKDNDTFIAPTRDCTYTLGIADKEAGFALRDNGSAGPWGSGVLIGVVHTAANGSHANEVAYSAAGVTLYDATGCVNELNCRKALVNNEHQTTWLNHRQLSGSAARYLSGSGVDPSLVAQLFAVDLLPDGGCTSPAYAALHSDWCYEYSKAALHRFPSHQPPNVDPPVLPIDFPSGRHVLVPVVGERLYSQLLTDTGPANGEVLPARLLAFEFSQ